MQKGVFYIILSGLSFLVVNFFVKILGSGAESLILPTSDSIPAHELVFFRSVISFSISFYLMKRKSIPILGNNKKWLLIRGFSGMIALTLFFYTIHYLPLAIASTIQYLAPLFTIILAIFIMKEQIKSLQWVFILLAFSGAILIGLSDFLTVESSENVSLFWFGIGILSALFSGIAYNAILKLKSTETPLNVVIYFPMLSIPVMGIWCLFDFTLPHGIAWLYILIIGVCTQIAQIALTKAFQYGDANTISPFQYLGSIYALLLGYFIFDEYLSYIAYLGIAMILFGVLFNLLVKHLKHRREKII